MIISSVSTAGHSLVIIMIIDSTGIITEGAVPQRVFDNSECYGISTFDECAKSDLRTSHQVSPSPRINVPWNTSNTKCILDHVFQWAPSLSGKWRSLSNMFFIQINHILSSVCPLRSVCLLVHVERFSSSSTTTLLLFCKLLTQFCRVSFFWNW